MISVIVPTFNRCSYLREAVESLNRQNLSKDLFEVIVVDNGSNDETHYVVDRAMQEYLDLKISYIYEPEPGLLSGRHKGAMVAKGDILVFIDDDIIADENWLESIAASFKRKDVLIVGGRNLPKYESGPAKWLKWFWSDHQFGKTCGHLSLLDFGDEEHTIDPRYVWGLNFAIRRDTLFELGGFHPDCVPPDVQYFQGDGETGLTIKAQERGMTALYQPKALVYHQVPTSRMTPDYFCKRYYYQGVADSFTQLRRTHGLYEPRIETGPNTKRQSYRQIIRRSVYRRAKATLSKIGLCQVFARARLRSLFQSHYLRGVNFHQAAAKNNPEIMEWVLRKDYWDYRLPAIRL